MTEQHNAFVEYHAAPRLWRARCSCCWWCDYERPGSAEDAVALHVEFARNLQDNFNPVEQRMTVSQDSGPSYGGCGQLDCKNPTHPVFTDRRRAQNRLDGASTIERRLWETEHELIAQKQRFEDFKTQVGQTANRYARQHHWCGVVQEALDELGIDAYPNARWYRIQLDIRTTGPVHGDWDTPEKLNTYNGGTFYIAAEVVTEDDNGESVEPHILLGHTALGDPIEVGPVKVLSVSKEQPNV